MFTLQLYDPKGQKLKLGDIVKISNGRLFTFFCEVTYLDKEKVIAPFQTFSFHSFEKIEQVPSNAVKSTEERYNIWYLYDEDAEPDDHERNFERYLLDWRSCESLIENRCYRIEKIN